MTRRDDALAFLVAHPRIRLLSGDAILLPYDVDAAEVEMARQMKPELLTLLRAEAERDEAEERSAIFQYEAGFSREDAERLAGIRKVDGFGNTRQAAA